MEKPRFQTIDEKIASLNKNKLLYHFKKLLIVFKQRLKKLEDNSNNQITDYALEAILKILANTGEKFPYMIDIDVDKEGNIIGINLRENPIYKWPFEAIGSNNSNEKDLFCKNAEKSNFPYYINQAGETNGGFSIFFINPISNPTLIHNGLKDQSFLGSLRLIASSYFETNTEAKIAKLVITGSIDRQLVYGLANERYFADNKIQNQSPIFSLNNQSP